MKRTILIFCAAMALLPGIAFAADVTGDWSAQVTGPDGNTFTVGYHFKQEGTKLTGTVEGPGGAIPIQNGKVEGDKISFSLSFNDMNVGSEGTIKGEEITMAIKINGEPFGGPATLKRSK